MDAAIASIIGNLGVGGILAGMFYLHLFKVVPIKEKHATEERERLVFAFREESESQRRLFREEQSAARQQHEELMNRLVKAITNSTNKD
jgi:uncharacterized membrane protein